MIANAFALSIYSGESISFETNLTNPVYAVVDNSSSLEGLNVTFENGNITILTNYLMASDNFTMIFFDNATREVVKTISSGGGGGGSYRYIDRNVTVYEPKFYDRNITNEVEVEKVIEKDKVVESRFGMKEIIFLGVVCLAFGAWAAWRWKKDED